MKSGLGAAFSKAIGIYLLLIHMGVVLVLILSSIIGYLPYSDRPGPGWHGPHFSIREAWFFLTWSLSFVPYSIIYGTGVYFLSQLMRLLRIPFLARAALSGLLSGFVSMHLVAGAGWMIAIAGPPVYISGIIGLVYGAWLLPRYLGHDLRGHPLSGREKIIVPVSLLMLGPLVYLAFFHKPYSQDFEVNIITTQDSLADMSEDDWLSEKEKSVLLEKKLNRKYEVRYQSMFSKGGNSEKSRVLIVMPDGTAKNAILPQPKNSNVVILEENGNWVMYPKDIETLKKNIHLKRLDNGLNQWVIGIEPNKEDTIRLIPDETPMPRPR